MKQVRQTDAHDFFYSKYKNQAHDIIFVLDNLLDPKNLWSFFRLAYALNIKHIYACWNQISSETAHQVVNKVSRWTHEKVSYSFESHTLPILEQLESQWYEIWAAEVADKSIPYYKAHFWEKVAIVFWNEKNWISQPVLDKVDKAVHLPIFNPMSSLWVMQVASVIWYYIVCQKN